MCFKTKSAQEAIAIGGNIEQFLQSAVLYYSLDRLLCSFWDGAEPCTMRLNPFSKEDPCLKATFFAVSVLKNQSRFEWQLIDLYLVKLMQQNV